MKINKSLVKYLLLLGLLIRVIFALTYNGANGDIELYRAWAKGASNDFFNVYNNVATLDYPPGYLYISFVIGKFINYFSFIPIEGFFLLLLKLPPIIADIITSIFIYKIARKYLSNEISIILMALYLFNPAILVNSSIWGQTDSILTLILVIAIHFITIDKIAFSSFFFAIMLITKPQGVIFLPILFMELIRRKSIKDVFISGSVGLFTVIILSLPFSFSQDLLWLPKLFLHDAGKYSYASLHAYNLHSLLGGDLKADTTKILFTNYKTIGLIFVPLVYLFCQFLYHKMKDIKMTYLINLILMLGIFILAPRMHERYIYPVMALCLIAYIIIKDKRLLNLFYGISITAFINQFMVIYFWNFGEYRDIWIGFFNSVTYIFSFINIFLLIYAIKISIDVIIKNKRVVDNNEQLQEIIK